jgi:DNA sulfur modification protein DndC
MLKPTIISIVDETSIEDMIPLTAAQTRTNRLTSIQEEIRNLYMTDPRPLYIGFSGGKDSTVTLSIVCQAIKALAPEHRTQQIFVLFSDTLMEMPPVIGQINNSIQSFIEYVAINELPFTFQKVEPELKNRFFNQIIGKGAALPRRDLRWCTQKMKITPMENAINLVLENFGGYIAFTGARKDESPDRAARLARNAVSEGSKLKVHADPRCNLFCPIEDWSSDDVWHYIYREAESWVNADALGLVYSEAAGDGDECTTALEGGEEGQKPGCGKSARYGCWVCPLFERDKTLGNLAQGHEYLVHMEDFRNWLVQFRDGKWDLVRDVYNHKDFKRLQYNYDNARFGTTSPGGYSLSFRQSMLEKLLETEKLSGITLIEEEDLEFIQHCWILEGDLVMTCRKMASKYRRPVPVSEMDQVYLRYAAVLFLTRSVWATAFVARFGIYVNERFCVQFVKEVIDSAPTDPQSLFFEVNKEMEVAQIIKDLGDIEEMNDKCRYMETIVVNMKVANQFYPKPDLEKLIRLEWKNDKASYATEVFIADNTGAELIYDEFEGDWLDNPDISLEDKMGMLDNWNHFTPESRPVINDKKGHKLPEVYRDFKYKERKVTASAE